jgi:MFS family permease
VGIGLSVANVFGLLCTVPIGRIADRFGARLPILITYAGLAVLFALYCGVSDFAGFVVLTSLISVGETSVNPLRMTLIRAVLAPADLVRVSAQMRSLSNVGFMAGAVIGGIAVPFGTRTAFCAVVLVTAVAQAACTMLIWRLPVPAHVRARGRGRAGRASRASRASARSGLRDIRFVGIALLCGVLEMYQPILTERAIRLRVPAPRTAEGARFLLEPGGIEMGGQAAA